MQTIVASKQVGDLSYFVADLNIFYTIIKTQKIKQGRNEEYNSKTREKSGYISLSRNMTAATLRNSGRWKYGIIIDGSKLSEKYHVEPFSFAGSQKNNKFKVKEIVRYDDGSCKLRIVNWAPIGITEQEFNFLKQLMLSQSPKFNSEHKFIESGEGKRKYLGKLVKEKYTYNVPYGDGGMLLKDSKDIPSRLYATLYKGPSTNEYEERIWTNSNYVDIKGCILGIILPKNELSDFETSDNKLISLIRDTLDSIIGDYKIMYY